MAGPHPVRKSSPSFSGGRGQQLRRLCFYRAARRAAAPPQKKRGRSLNTPGLPGKEFKQGEFDDVAGTAEGDVDNVGLWCELHRRSALVADLQAASTAGEGSGVPCGSRFRRARGAWRRATHARFVVGSWEAVESGAFVGESRRRLRRQDEPEGRSGTDQWRITETDSPCPRR